MREQTKRGVFCPGIFERATEGTARLRGAYEAAAAVCPILFVALHPAELELIGHTGVNTLFSPWLPERHGEAISRADFVITCHPTIRDFAQRQGKQVIWINLPCALPEVDLTRDFGERARRRPVGKKLRKTLTIATVFDRNYLPHWLGLRENLRAVANHELSWQVLALDDESAAAAAHHRARVYRLRDVWSPKELKRIQQRTIALQAFSSKPALCALIAKRLQRPFLYVDTDLYFFRSPLQLLQRLTPAHPTLLFPQWNDSLPHARLHGLFNTGLIGLSKNSIAFLDWWRAQCLETCVIDEKNGFFIDQGFVDLAPVHFPNIQIYREGDENIGFWNWQTLEAKRNGDLFTCHDDLPIGSWHAAGPDPLGAFDWKVTRDQLATFFSQTPGGNLRAEVVRQQAQHWPSLAQLQRADFTLRSRLNLPLPQFQDAQMSYWLSPQLAPIRKATALAYHQLRKLKRSVVPADRSPFHQWPQWQAKLRKWAKEQQ